MPIPQNDQRMSAHQKNRGEKTTTTESNLRQISNRDKNRDLTSITSNTTTTTTNTHNTGGQGERIVREVMRSTTDSNTKEYAHRVAHTMDTTIGGVQTSNNNKVPEQAIVRPPVSSGRGPSIQSTVDGDRAIRMQMEHRSGVLGGRNRSHEHPEHPDTKRRQEDEHMANTYGPQHTNPRERNSDMGGHQKLGGQVTNTIMQSDSNSFRHGPEVGGHLETRTEMHSDMQHTPFDNVLRWQGGPSDRTVYFERFDYSPTTDSLGSGDISACQTPPSTTPIRRADGSTKHNQESNLYGRKSDQKGRLNVDGAERSINSANHVFLPTQDRANANALPQQWNSPSAGSNCNSRNSQNVLRMHRRRTICASEEEMKTLPLHTKPVERIEWETARELVKTHVPELLQLWDDTTKYFTTSEVIKNILPAHGNGATSTREEHSAKLTTEDINTLLRAKLIRKTTGDSIPTCRSFTVTEKAKHRRRWILVPLLNSHTKVEIPAHITLFPKTEDIVKGALEECACCFDFAAFFHVFTTCNHFTFIHDGVVYEACTIPTGARQPPIFAQILATALATAAVKITQDVRITFVTWIDNVRFTGPRDALERVASVFRALVIHTCYA